MQSIQLLPLEKQDVEQFVVDNQKAFRYGAMEEFGLRDNHFEEDGEIIARQTILQSIAEGEAYRIWRDGQKVGGLVLCIRANKGELSLLFVNPDVHSEGIGFAAWQAVEASHPEVDVWETYTPYFERRNIHFYVNRCGFHIVEYFNSHHPDPHNGEGIEEMEDNDGMFRFEKRMRG